MSFRYLGKNSKKHLNKQTSKEQDTTYDERTEKPPKRSWQNLSKSIDLLNNATKNLRHRITVFEPDEKILEFWNTCYSEKMMEPEIGPIDMTVEISDDIDKPYFCVHTRAKVIHSLKKHLGVINYFDGSNRSVEGFISDVQLVLNLLSEKEKIFFIKLVYAKKVIGDAKLLLDQFIISTVESFFEYLRYCYGDTKIFSNAKIYRNRCIQGSGSVLTYNNKFQRAQLYVIKAIMNNPALTACQKKTNVLIETRNGLKEYIAGLHYDLRILMECFYPNNLQEAQEMALEIEKKWKNISFRDQQQMY